MQPQTKPFFFTWMIALILMGISMLPAQPIRVWEVTFDYGSARLTPQALAALDTLPVGYAQTVSLYGHTDLSEAGSTEEALCARRMDAVADALMQRQPNMPAPLRHSMAHSQPALFHDAREPLGNVIPEQWKQNCRVVIVAGYARDNLPPVVRTDYTSFLPTRQLVFTRNADKPLTLNCNQGTVLEIPAGAFTVNGKPVTGPVEITVKEAYRFDDMLRNALATVTSDGKLLETGGMLRIDVTAGGQPVDAELAQSIEVAFGTQKLPKGMEAFYGSQDSANPATTVWQQAGQVYAVVSLPSIGLVSGDGSDIYGTGASYFFGHNENEATTQITQTLTIDRMGWINCDRFLDLPPNTLRTVTASVPAGFRADSCVAALYLKSYNSVMPGYFREGAYQFQNIPVNTQATVVLVQKNGATMQAAMKPLVVSEKPVSLSPGSHSVEQVLAYLKTY